MLNRIAFSSRPRKACTETYADTSEYAFKGFEAKEQRWVEDWFNVTGWS